MCAEDNGERFELFKRGFSDCDIGRALGLDSSTIWHWRKRNKLERNRHMVENLYRAKRNREGFEHMNLD